MDQATIYTVLISLLTALGSSQAWSFYQHRSTIRAGQIEDKKKQANLYRDDLRDEVQSLRVRLHDAQEKIIELSRKLAAMTVRVEFLERDNLKLSEVQEA